MTDPNFRDRVHALVAQIPYGRVMTYGDIAVRCGSPRSARIVGTVAHFGPEDLPWHRVVNRFGGMAIAYWGGPEAHRARLEAEDVPFTDDGLIADFKERRWQPSMSQLS